MHKVFDLRGVEPDEAQAMRTALTEGDIDFYETDKPNWFAGAPAFWVKSEDQLEVAKEIIAAAQERWVLSAAQQNPEKIASSRFDWEILLFLTVLAALLSGLLWLFI